MAEAAALAAAQAADEERRTAKERAGWWPLAYYVLEYEQESPHVRRYALTLDEKTNGQVYMLTPDPSIGWSFPALRDTQFAPWPPYGRWEQYASLKGKNPDVDAAYARIRSTPAPYIGNARLMAFDFGPGAAWDCFGIPTSTAFSSYRVELTLSDRGAEGSRDLHKCVSFASTTDDKAFHRPMLTPDGIDPKRMLVIRAVESVRMLGVPKDKPVPRHEDEDEDEPAPVPVSPDLWSPRVARVKPAHPNVPHFVAMVIRPDEGRRAAPGTYTHMRMFLLDAAGKYNNALQRWWDKVGASINPWNTTDYSFPTTCSDPHIRTDPFTLAQEQAGRTNRVSVADVARLARPFHGRQKRVLEQYLPHNKFVQNAKKQMLEGGMLEKPAQASLLPSLAGLKV